MSANIRQYLLAFQKSQQFANYLKVNRYPINIFNTLRCSSKILVSSLAEYKSWATQAGLACPDKMQDAKCYFHPDKDVYIIVYNEKQPKRRISFSLAHELGHILLKHLDDIRTEIDRGGLDDPTYFSMEGAANTFAGNFLAPPIIIHECLSGGHFDVDRIANFFDLSKQAVRDYRKQDYQYWLSLPHEEYENHILQRYKLRLHTHLCGICGYKYIIENAVFCPICGAPSTPLAIGDETIMGRTFPSIATNEAGQAAECPNCKNIEHLKEASFCMICGKPIINQCTFAISDNIPYDIVQCTHIEPLPGNARYCPYCGSETTFLKEGLLLKWQQEPQEPTSSFFAELADDEGDLPF